MRDVNLNDQEVQAVLAAQGPFVSLYLHTEVTSEQAPRDMDLRWRGLRDKAEAAGAHETALSALDDVVDGAHARGRSLAAVAAPGGVVLRRHLGGAVRDNVTFDGLPHLVPLIEARQEHPTYVVVLADRQGAEIYGVNAEGPTGEVTVEGEAGPHLTRTKAEGSQRHYQQRAENLWESNATEVAEALTSAVNATGAQLVVVAGDVRAVSFMEEHLPDRVKQDLVEAGGGRGESLEDMQDQLDDVVAEWAARASESILATFKAERARAERAADGLDPTLEALRRSQVETLLLSPAAAGGRRAWFTRADPAQTAADKQALIDMGFDDLEEAAMIDALVRAAYGTGAAVRIIPDLGPDQGPANGVGAILRFI